jgi:hypothetical protein
MKHSNPIDTFETTISMYFQIKAPKRLFAKKSSKKAKQKLAQRTGTLLLPHQLNICTCIKTTMIE